jgi:hypothetical protein
MMIVCGGCVVEYRGGMLFFFKNKDVVWYDATNGIAKDGWEKELEPYEGQADGMPFDHPHAYEWRTRFAV